MKTQRVTLAFATASAIAMLAANSANAYEPGDLMLMLLAQGFYTDASGNVGQGTGWNYDSGTMSINPALNITYFLTKNVAAQTVLAVPKLRVDVSGGGQSTGATDQWVLPLSIIGQYHFYSDEIISPFLGAGLTYAKLWEDESRLGNDNVDVGSTWGGLINFGLNVKIPDSRWVVGVDVKKWWLAPASVEIGNDSFGDLTVNPWFFGAGIGYNFSTPALF